MVLHNGVRNALRNGRLLEDDIPEREREREREREGEGERERPTFFGAFPDDVCMPGPLDS